MNNRFIFKISALFATALLVPAALFAQNTYSDVPGEFSNDGFSSDFYASEGAGNNIQFGFSDQPTKVRQQPITPASASRNGGAQPLGTPRTTTGPGTGPLQGGIQGTTGTGPLTGEFKGSGSVFYDPNTSLQISSSELTAGADCQSNGLETYCLLAPIDSDKEIKTDEYGFFYYINKIINYAFGLAGIVAVLALVAGGLQYIASGTSLTQAQGGRDRINKAFIGLGIMLASYLLLYTISPELVQFQLKIPDICRESERDPVTKKCPTVSQVERAPAPARLLTQSKGPAPSNLNPIGSSINPRITTYSPPTQPGTQSSARREGGDATAYPDKAGFFRLHTIDDYAATLDGTVSPQRATSYITLAGDDLPGSSQIRRHFIIPSITYIKKDGSSRTLTDVPAYVHDTGDDFKGDGATHYDVALGLDYSDKQMASQPYNEKAIQLIPAETTYANK